ncbi:MAG: Hsp70 family protein [Salinibacterium sp.]|nr:Hsp70 family protein [Salinibacterium sp.]MBF0673083.1 Hsp70 family protein [Salinibacterium sp.]
MSEARFALAIDIGGSHIVVATAALSQSEQTDVALHQWGHERPTAPAIAYLSNDDTLLFGDDAAESAAADPPRAVTNFCHRLGDDIPFVIDGCALSAEYVFSKAVSWVIDAVADVQRAAPAAIVLTHPAHWGEHRLDVLRVALREEGIGPVSTIPAAKAVALHHDRSHPIEPGDTLAVYDLGAETVESVVLRKRHDGHFEFVGDAVHIDGTGGTRFEDAVLEHVVAAAQLDTAAVASHHDALLLRDELRRAKETLSAHPDATVALPGGTSVRVTRAEFENAIAAEVEHSLDAVTQAIDSAQLSHDDLSTLVLAGGSSRIPFVTQRLADRFERPTASDPSPEAAAALGAAHAGLAELRAQQVLEQVADEASDEFDEEAQRFSPALLRAAHGRSAHRKGSLILPAVVIAALAGALVVGGAAALGDTRVDPFGGTTPRGDAFEFDGIWAVPANASEDVETTPDEKAPAPDGNAGAAEPGTGTRSSQAVRPPLAPQRPVQSALIAQQPRASSPSSSAATRPPAKSPSTPSSTATPTQETPADPHPAETPPPSTHPTTPPADPSPPLDPDPEPAPVADPPPTSDPPTEPAPQDPVPQDPAPQDPVQEQPPGVQTN